MDQYISIPIILHSRAMCLGWIIEEEETDKEE